MHYEVTPLFSTPLLKTHQILFFRSYDTCLDEAIRMSDSSVAQYGNEDHLPERGFDVLNQPKLSNLQVLIKHAVDHFAHTVLDVVDDTEFVLTTSWTPIE